MIYIKRAVFIICLMVALIVYPWEMCLRYILTGKDPHEKTWAYKMVKKIC
jgi:hypothetical protein